jgi:hypothetical protein
VLATQQQSAADLPSLVVTGTIGEEQASQLMKAGADDFFLKGSRTRLTPTLKWTLREAAHCRAREAGEQDVPRIAAFVLSCEDAIIAELVEALRAGDAPFLADGIAPPTACRSDQGIRRFRANILSVIGV